MTFLSDDSERMINLKTCRANMQIVGQSSLHLIAGRTANGVTLIQGQSSSPWSLAKSLNDDTC